MLQPDSHLHSSSWIQKAWDLFCIFSVVGIWPRFIEPHLLSTTSVSLPICDLPADLKGLKILHFSDLHIHPKMSEFFLQKLSNRICKLSPDLIVFTGDFLRYAQLSSPERLGHFLRSLHAPHGCYAVLGNHDYAQYVSLNSEGDYDIADLSKELLIEAWKRFFKQITPSKKVRNPLPSIEYHTDFMNLLKETPFQLLNNHCLQIPIRDTFLNLCGLEEYSLGKPCLEKAFTYYDSKYPGIILMHNPDGAAAVENYPGNIILSGHTHGGQVNIPFIREKMTLLENPQRYRGLSKLAEKWLYINRGVGSTIDFRWFSIPELTLITLEPSK
jgi:predicted MPP superfamily phosphohydrolase